MKLKWARLLRTLVLIANMVVVLSVPLTSMPILASPTNSFSEDTWLSSEDVDLEDTYLPEDVNSLEEIADFIVTSVPSSIYCRSGYRAIPSTGVPGLCITYLHGARRYDEASRVCRDKRGRVASYEDLFYLYRNSSYDAYYNPYGRWIGNFVHDDVVFCGNRHITIDGDPDMWNFEGHCNKTNSRRYWCAHDPN